MQVVALTGQPSCGKGVVAKVFKEEFGYEVRVFSSILRELVAIEGEEVTRERLQVKGDEIRAKHGPGILVEWLLEQAADSGVKRLVIDGLRSTGEAKKLKELGGTLIGVEASMDNVLRWYLERGRDDDKATEERFWQLISRENLGIDDREMNIKKCLEMADIVISNSGSLTEFMNEVRLLGKQLQGREGGIAGKER